MLLITETQVCEHKNLEIISKIYFPNLTVASDVNYYIIATDYFQYAVGWACETLGLNQSREFAWVLSRSPEWPVNSTFPDRVANLTRLHFDEELMRSTTQNENM